VQPAHVKTAVNTVVEPLREQLRAQDVDRVAHALASSSGPKR
jgi:hypothetical protein